MERTLLARHADVLVTMDDARREIRDGALFVRGNRIECVGTTGELPPTADTVIDLTGHVLLPGLVNTHHHMFQTLTRAVPAAQDSDLFGWLKALYPVWSRLTPDAIPRFRAHGHGGTDVVGLHDVERPPVRVSERLPPRRRGRRRQGYRPPLSRQSRRDESRRERRRPAARRVDRG
jgi:hypothetical protein